MGGKSGFNCLGVKGPALVSFLFYVNVSEMHPWSRLSSQPLAIPASWVTVSRFLVSLRGINPPLSLLSYFSMISCLSSFPDPQAI